MQRLITTTFLALSLLLSLALWSAGRNVKATTMLAASSQLNPTAFTSLGASPFTTAGTYLIDASRNNAAPTLTELGLAAPIVGVFYSPSSGVVLRDELAVFTFNALTIPTGVTVQGVRNANSRPLALLSQSTITLDGTLDVSGPGGGAASGKIGGVVGMPARVVAVVAVVTVLVARRSVAGWGLLGAMIVVRFSPSGVGATAAVW